MPRQSPQDMHTYRALRRIYFSQRKFWAIADQQRGDTKGKARKERITEFLGKRRKYARSLTNGRYDEYGYIRRG